MDAAFNVAVLVTANSVIRTSLKTGKVQMTAFDLEDIRHLPSALLERLSGFDHLFSAEEYLETAIERDRSLRTLIRDINQHCLSGTVIGYHYTRAFPGDILTNGLKARTGEEWRRTFLAQHRDRFTDDEINAIQCAWARYYDSSAKAARDNRIFFTFNWYEPTDSAVRLLLQHFGGEQIYFALLGQFPAIASKLSTIGEPLILKCTLDPSDIRVTREDPWGMLVASVYHRVVKPTAYKYGFDGYTLKPVAPQDIELSKSR